MHEHSDVLHAVSSSSGMLRASWRTLRTLRDRVGIIIIGEPRALNEV